MQQILERITRIARDADAVASHAVPNGLQLLAYPLEEGMLIALGVEGRPNPLGTAESMLQQRARQMMRLGAWLPSMFADGSCYLVRRLSAEDERRLPQFLLDELAAAEEVLS